MQLAPLSPTQLVLAQADAIARLARLRSLAQPQLTAQGHLRLEMPAENQTEVQATLGRFAPNLVRVLLWEQKQAI